MPTTLSHRPQHQQGSSDLRVQQCPAFTPLSPRQHPPRPLSGSSLGPPQPLSLRAPAAHITDKQAIGSDAL
eukprot:jgi/Chlat1/2691/Chrsp180S02867